MLVYFVRILTQISTQDIAQFNKIIRDNEVYNGIIIANKGLNTSAEKLLKDINIDEKYHLEYFHVEDLMVNISKHVLVPKHELCDEEEKQMVLRKYRAKEQQLPKILVSDPMAKYLGARKGNLVKITRDSTTAGEYVVYRLAI